MESNVRPVPEDQSALIASNVSKPENR